MSSINLTLIFNLFIPKKVKYCKKKKKTLTLNNIYFVYSLYIYKYTRVV